jgi:1-acyl-sn-glycerol-3-phosphate acyltransferase
MRAMSSSADDRDGAAPAAVPPLRGVALVVAAIRSFATYLAISVYVILVGPPGLLIAWLFTWPGLLFVLSHGGVGLGLALSGISARLVGAERIPRGRAAVYCPNHTSNIDAPLLFHVLHPRLHMLYKAEFGRMPILGRAAPVAGFIPVERQNHEQSQKAVDLAAESVARGHSFLVFPEGTRSRTGELLPFKKGGFIMAIKAQAPIVPVAIIGGRAAMTRGSRLIRPAMVDVRVGEPIETTGMTLDDRDRLIALARVQIEGMLRAVPGSDQWPVASGQSNTGDRPTTGN